MDDPLLVSRFERFSDLLRDGQRLIELNRTLRDAIRQCRAFDQFHDERVHRTGCLETVDLRDVGMVEGREDLSFAFESGDALSIFDQRLRDRKSTRLNSSHLGISYAV